MKFSRGYGEVDKKVNRCPQLTSSCGNCDYYYKGEDDTEEVCHNSSVTSYDICVDKENNRVSCILWKPVE